MSAGELGALLASISAKPPSSQTDAAVKRLTQLLCRAAPGKENCSAEELRTAALQALKAAQARLGEAGADPTAATQQHAALGRAALAALEACSVAGSAGAASLLPLHYNFVKRLVAARSYEAAWAEATALHARLAGRGAGTAAAPPRTAEAANVAVGAVLMLLLCCVDSPVMGGAKLQEAVQAAQSLEPWLGVLPPAEAEKHRDALFKYMYKAVAQLLERREHGLVAAVVSAMAAVAESDPHRHRVLQAALKFSAHLPDDAVLEMAAAVAAALLGSDNPLSDALSLELVGLLCTACQRAGAAAAAAPAAFSCGAWATLVQCGSSPSPVLQQAALLLPCLAMQRGSSCAQPTGWVQPVSLALAAARASAAALQQHLERPSLLPEQVQHHALVLAAAWQPANLLRKALAPDPGAACQQLGSSDAVAAAAEQLELQAILVRAAHAAGAAGVEGGAAAAQLGVMAKQGHAAAVGLTTAAKLRAAHGGEQLVPVVSADVAAALLGWDFQTYCSLGCPLPQPGLLSEQELSWLVAALYNVGVDLHSAGQFGTAVAPLLAAVSASICCLMGALQAGSGEQVVQQRAQDVAKRCSALSDAQLRAGDTAAAASTLAHGIAALVQCGLGVAAWQDLLGSLARQTLDVLLAQHEQQAEAGVSGQPVPKGKGARAAKRPAARGKAAAPAPSSSNSGSSEGSLVQCSCTGILASHHSAAVPIAARAVVAEQELRTWAALATRADSAAAAAHCSQLCTFLLEQAFPAEECPVEHALILLAAHETGLPAGELAGPELLARAAAVLDGGAQADGTVSTLAARVYGLLALAAGQQLVDQSVAEQRQQRQQSHAQASTSSGGVASDVAEVQGLPSSPCLEAWQRVAAQAEAAVQHLEAAVEQAAAADQAQQHVDWEALAHLVAELGFMAALQGRIELEARCQQLCLDILTLVQTSPGSQLMRWAATTPAGSWLCSCLFPGLRAPMAQRLPDPEACLEAWPASLAALHSAATGSEQPALAALVSSRQQLAAGPRDAGTALQRACLHRLAAEQEGSAGNLVSALYHATKAHRLAFSLGSGGALQQQHSAAAAAAGVGWWQLAAEQLCSLMQLGRLFEVSGMADEALHALKEGLRMAASTGSTALMAAFRIELASIYANQGSAAAQQVLAPVASLVQAAQGSKGLDNYLQAQQLAVQAQLSMAAGEHSAALEAYQVAGNLCRQAGAADPVLASHIAALQGAAVLGQAQCLAGEGGDAQAAARLALEAVEMLGGETACCSSSSLQPRAAGLLFLALQESSQPQQQAACLWGLQPGPASGSAPSELRASSSRAAPAVKKPAGARGKAAAAAAKELPAATGDAGSCPGHCLAAQRLWLAYWLTREVPHVHRLVAAHLANECGRAGYTHVAALLLHTSLGATMRQQYRLVLHTKLQQLQRASRVAGADVEQQRSVLQSALSQLGEPLDEALVCQLAGVGAVAPALQPSQPAKGRRHAAASVAPGPDPAPAQELLAALEQQAEGALRRWMAALPEGTVVCSLSVAPGGGSTSSSSSSRVPGGAGEQLVISRLASGAAPVILQLPPPEALAAGAAQHPIRALSLEPEDSAARSSSRHHPLAEDMLRLLEDSGRSMRELATDTKEQQREWWRERVALDDRLAALLQAMGTEWLSGWRCLLLGAAAGSQGQEGKAEHIMQQLQAHVGAASRPALTQQQLGIVRAAVSSLLEGSSSSSGLSPGELQAACGQLSSCLGLDLSPEQATAVLDGGGSSSSAGVAEAPEAPGSSRTAAAAAGAAAKPAARGRRAKTVTFQVEEEAQPESEPLQPRGRHGQQQQPQQQQAPARGQRVSARSSKAAAAAMAAVTPAPLAPHAAEAEGEGAGCSPPAATGGEAGGLSSNLCDVFDAMSLEPAVERSSRALTTARATKHRSRLRMMQASTPGPAPSSSRAGGDLPTSTARGAATAPRMRAARSRPTAAGAEEGDGANASSGSSSSGGGSSSTSSQEPQRGPVLLVLDGALQALPWESVPGLRSQRIYRIPSLACAAASAGRSLREVDLSSTFYSLNPSGDLGSTQSTFQDWFARLPWEGKAGEPPTAAELAAALQSHQLFVYFGHGGGDQYIPAGTLRALDSCSAALLMGCSSGRLRLRGAHYEPSGPVLAYLLAGCPTAVANLWDVTDRDIDRFSQALLSAWLDKSGAAGPGGGLVGAAAGGAAVAAGSAAAAAASGGPSGVPTPVKMDISSAVAASRAACKLPHLIGAAPVCYGLPTSVQ